MFPHHKPGALLNCALLLTCALSGLVTASNVPDQLPRNTSGSRLQPDASTAAEEFLYRFEQSVAAQSKAIVAAREAARLPLGPVVADTPAAAFWRPQRPAAKVSPLIEPSELFPAVCFAPDTPRRVVEDFYYLRRNFDLEFYRLGTRWSTTATNGGGLAQGDSTTITWSIIPDGTNIPGGAVPGEPTGPSNLIAFLNGIYGNQATWLPLFEGIFNRWAELTGVRYVYQATDDGGAFPSSQGLLGTRGDVRIGGHFIDGNSNVLAYNYFPNTGDMVIDTGDGFYSDTANNSLRFRNVLSHEHGHGLGLNHVCPSEGKKLMEPFVNLSFDGPQIDDRVAGNRGYGDRLEAGPNNTAATATNLGASLANGQYATTELSIDDNSDVDFFQFGVASGNRTASIVIQPVGAIYLEGPQNANGTCTAGTNFNALTISDLGVELLDSNGTTVLASANVNPAGQAETIMPIPVSGAGPYYIRVFGANNDNAQLYSMTLTIASATPGPVIQANGSTLDAENCPPANSFIDPDETVTVSYTLRNIGNVATGNLVATLQSSAAVLSPSAPQSYGSIAPNTSVTRQFTFTAAGICGSNALATLLLQDGATNLGTVTFAFTLGGTTSSTSTFSNTNNITIPTSGAANPYPSTINVTGITQPVTKVTVVLNNLTHAWLADLDVMLVSPTGQKLMLMSDAGTDNNGPPVNGTPVNNVTFTFSDSAAGGVPQTHSVISGTYNPTDFSPGENLPAPAPAGPYGTGLNAFNGANPNGNWTLYVSDDTSPDGGALGGGWTLNITTTAAVCCDVPDLKILGIERLGSGNMRITGRGVPNATHTIQLSEDLSFTAADPTAPVSADATGFLLYEDSNPGTRRFYRFTYP